MAAAKQAANDEYQRGAWESAAQSYEKALALSEKADGFNAQVCRTCLFRGVLRADDPAGFARILRDDDVRAWGEQCS
eukprot:571016-Rhodomonas_salina.1